MLLLLPAEQKVIARRDNRNGRRVVSSLVVTLRSHEFIRFCKVADAVLMLFMGERTQTFQKSAWEGCVATPTKIYLR